MNLVFANTTAQIGGPNGTIINLEAGTAWDGDDPFVAHRPEFFDTLPAHVHTSAGVVFTAAAQNLVETATAEPGAKRRRGRATGA